MVATESEDVRFLVLMAGPGTPYWRTISTTNYLAEKLAGMTDEMLLQSKKINENIYAFIKNYRYKLWKDLRSF
jgi:hypothetical protein